MFGLTKGDFWFDFDLAGAYSTAMAAIKIPDWQGIRTSTNLDDCQRRSKIRPCGGVKVDHLWRAHEASGRA